MIYEIFIFHVIKIFYHFWHASRNNTFALILNYKGG